MRILVTGANGQLGNEMQVLAKENPHIRIISQMCRNSTFVMHRLYGLILPRSELN